VSKYFGGYFAPTYFARGYFGPVAPIRIVADDGGDVVKRFFRDRQIREFEEALAAMAEDAPQEAAQAALKAFAPVAAAVVGEAEIAAARAISDALRTAMERQRGHAALVRVIEAELARIVKMRRRRRDEAALLLLGAL